MRTTRLVWRCDVVMLQRAAKPFGATGTAMQRLYALVGDVGVSRSDVDAVT